jgi:hypothetical protein
MAHLEFKTLYADFSNTLLGSVAGLAGATLRIPNSFLIAISGGRNVVALTTAYGVANAALTFAFGGASQYNGRSMRTAHSRLVEQMNLSDQHFDAVAENLAATLQELAVSPDLVQEVLGLVETLRNEVLSR